jgi:hypothetical protein
MAGALEAMTGVSKPASLETLGVDKNLAKCARSAWPYAGEKGGSKPTEPWGRVGIIPLGSPPLIQINGREFDLRFDRRKSGVPSPYDCRFGPGRGKRSVAPSKPHHNRSETPHRRSRLPGVIDALEKKV